MLCWMIYGAVSVVLRCVCGDFSGGIVFPRMLRCGILSLIFPRLFSMVSKTLKFRNAFMSSLIKILFAISACLRSQLVGIVFQLCFFAPADVGGHKPRSLAEVFFGFVVFVKTGGGGGGCGGGGGGGSGGFDLNGL